MLDASDIKALTFDVFVTVVDWRGSNHARPRRTVLKARRPRIECDWAKFAAA